MKTYMIVVRPGRLELSDYIEGRISGAIYALTGNPKMEYALHEAKNGSYVKKPFDATEDQFKAVVACIDSMYEGVIDYEFIECRETQEGES